MQQLDAPPRGHLTVEQVTALLLGDRVEVDCGAEVLNLDLTVNTGYGISGDISADLLGGTIQRQMARKIHATCDISLAQNLPWGNVLIQLYVILRGGGLEARFNVGVFMLTDPVEPIGESPRTYQVHGEDRLYLLDRQVADDYSIAATTTGYDALEQVFTDAGVSGYLIDGAAHDLTIPVDRDWPLVASSGAISPGPTTDVPTTWVRILNDVLLSLNFAGVWVNEDGLYRCQQYRAPAERTPEFLMDANDPTRRIVGERTMTGRLRSHPNRWVFRWTNRPGGMSSTEGVGKYTVTLPDTDPMSEAGRGVDWPEVIDYEAASFDVLEALGDRRVALDRERTVMYEVTTGPFPAASHFDLFTYKDDEARGSRIVVADEFTMDLAGGDMRWKWRDVKAAAQ